MQNLKVMHTITLIQHTHSYLLGWLYYDDENVHQVKDEKVVDKNAYILFYTRRTQINVLTL